MPTIPGLKDLLLDPNTTSDYGLGGNNIPQMESSKPQSKLHFKYSITGNPGNVVNQHPDLTGTYTLPTPSNLDLNGVTPPQYLNNHPN